MSKNKLDDKITDLSDLSNFRSFFEPQDTTVDKITDADHPLNKTNNLEEVSLREGTLDGAIDEYKVVLHNNGTSIRIKELRFSNFIKNSSDTSNDNSKIVKLLSLNNNYYSIPDLPIEIDNDIIMNRRLREILNTANIDISKAFTKWKYKDESMLGMQFNKAGDLMRVIAYTDNDHLIIVIIDPYHLFADSRQYMYREVNGFTACISSLFKHVGVS